mmetsp:Transcript_38349/g.69787  ORF Transcript_38349/g.69787 Transcript_38349/m.69787 type:complete len:81 (-) Transcript_38349:953-1195(-)
MRACVGTEKHTMKAGLKASLANATRLRALLSLSLLRGDFIPSLDILPQIAEAMREIYSRCHALCIANRSEIMELLEGWQR